MKNRWKRVLMTGLLAVMIPCCLNGCTKSTESGAGADRSDVSEESPATGTTGNLSDANSGTGTGETGNPDGKAGETGEDSGQTEGENGQQTEADEEQQEKQAQAKQKEEEERKLRSKKLKAALIETLSENETSGNWAVYLYCLDSKASAQAGDTEQMQAASLIKLFVFGSVAENWKTVVQMSSGEDEVYSLLKKMITVSDNDAANTLITRLGEGDSDAGKEVVNDFCEDHNFTQTHLGRLLLESNDLDDNYTSVKDCADLLELAYKGDLKMGEKLLKYMTEQERTSKIPAGIPDGVVTGNKTGELGDVENDTAIIWADEEPYILCVMTEDLSDTYAARMGIVNISSDVYNSVTNQE